jgi:DNA processing protein
LAVVGTREATPEALVFTAELVKKLGEAGFSVWSGGAEGIDYAVHRAAVSSGVKTVVVSPSGWDRPYPEKHAELYRQIVALGGGFLSMVAPDRAAQQHLFFERNALLMALTQGAIVVQAGFRSGARNAAKHARHLGRPLFVVPSCPWVRQGLGCNWELNYGARPINSAKDVIKYFAASGLCGAVTSESEGEARSSELDTESRTRSAKASNAAPVGRASDGLDGELGRLFEVLKQGATTVDEVCRRTGWSASVVQSDLLRLTLQGYVRVGRSGGIEIVNS